MNISWITAPVVGAVIGYITNDLAIRMLFHPHRAVYIGKFRVPFTPGLIPKEKSRVAASLGRMISGQLLNDEVIEKALLSDEMTEKLGKAFDSFAEKHRHSRLTVYETAEKYLGIERTADMTESLSAKLVGIIKKTVMEQEPGKVIAEKVMEYVDQNISGFVKNLLPVFEESLRPFIKNAVDKIISDNIDDAARTAVEGKLDDIKNIRIYELAERHEDKIEKLRAMLIDFYRSVITYKLSDIINSVNISNIVEERVNDFSTEELERLIFGIMKKELKMIVYLGALLGMLMGFVNLLF